jgi:hypothetical protein
MDPDSSEPSAPAPVEDAPHVPETVTPEPAAPEPVVVESTAPAETVTEPPADPTPVQELDAAAAPGPIDAPVAAVSAAPIPTTALKGKSSTIDTPTLLRLGHEGRVHKKNGKLERIMAEAARKGRLTSRDAAIAAEISKRTAEVYLDGLAAAGRLEKHLAGNATEYRFVR